MCHMGRFLSVELVPWVYTLSSLVTTLGWLALFELAMIIALLVGHVLASRECPVTYSLAIGPNLSRSYWSAEHKVVVVIEITMPLFCCASCTCQPWSLGGCVLDHSTTCVLPCGLDADWSTLCSWVIIHTREWKMNIIGFVINLQAQTHVLTMHNILMHAHLIVCGDIVCVTRTSSIVHHH